MRMIGPLHQRRIYFAGDRKKSCPLPITPLLRLRHALFAAAASISLAQAPLAEFMNRALQASGLSELLEQPSDDGASASPAAPAGSNANNLTQGAMRNWTLFAPTGDAWQRFVRHSSSRRTEEDLLRDPSLKALLMHHLAEGVFDPQAR